MSIETPAINVATLIVEEAAKKELPSTLEQASSTSTVGDLESTVNPLPVVPVHVVKPTVTSDPISNELVVDPTVTTTSDGRTVNPFVVGEGSTPSRHDMHCMVDASTSSSSSSSSSSDDNDAGMQVVTKPSLERKTLASKRARAEHNVSASPASSDSDSDVESDTESVKRRKEDGAANDRLALNGVKASDETSLSEEEAALCRNANTEGKVATLYVMDVSGSMNTSSKRSCMTAMQVQIEKHAEAGAVFALHTVNNEKVRRLSFGTHTVDEVRAVNLTSHLGGGTCMWMPIAQDVVRAHECKLEHLKIVVLTDGMDNKSSPKEWQDVNGAVLLLALARLVGIHVSLSFVHIGSSKRDTANLQAVSCMSGGAYHALGDEDDDNEGVVELDALDAFGDIIRTRMDTIDAATQWKKEVQENGEWVTYSQKIAPEVKNAPDFCVLLIRALFHQLEKEGKVAELAACKAALHVLRALADNGTTTIAVRNFREMVHEEVKGTGNSKRTGTLFNTTLFRLDLPAIVSRIPPKESSLKIGDMVAEVTSLLERE